MTITLPEADRDVSRTRVTPVAPLFMLAAGFVVYAVLAPRWLEPIYEQFGIEMVTEASLFENVAFQLWLFAVPIAVILASVGGSLTTGVDGRLAWLFGVGGVAAIIVPLTVAGFVGRTYGWLFGIGGTTIAVLALLTAWSWGRRRPQLPSGLRRASDLRMGGYVGFAFAAWFTCGLFALPVYGLDTSKMIALDTAPLAMSMAYAMMTFFVVGWLLTYASHVVERRHAANQPVSMDPNEPTLV